MQAKVTTRRDGTVLLRMDQEAAHATFASVIFASRYHEEIRGMEKVARRALTDETKSGDRRNTTCR
jgi:hypothetical protein